MNSKIYKLKFSVLLILISCYSSTLKSQCDPVDNWEIEYAANEDIRIKDLIDLPGTTTFSEMLGTNANVEWDQIYSNSDCETGENPFKNLLGNVRSFHLGEKDYSKKCNGTNTCNVDGCLNFGSFEICPPTQRGTDGPFTGLCYNGGLDKYRFRYDSWNEDWGNCVDVGNDCDEDLPFCASNNLHLSAALLVAPINADDAYQDEVDAFNAAHKFPMGWWTPSEWSETLDPIEIKENAYAYADAFIKTMCPDGDCIVDMLEIGNEPWAYSWDPSMGDYETIYAAISRGAVEAFIDNFSAEYGTDSDNWPVQLMPAAFQARYNESDPDVQWDNYLGRRIVENIASNYAGINIHPYSLKVGENNWTHPEDVNSEFHSIANAVRWRDHNMPCKIVYASEFGWDSYPFPDTPAENPGDFEGGVGEAAQAAYLLRATLMMARAKVEKAVLFNSNDGPLWHADFFRTAGLIALEDCGGSNNPVGQPKQSFYAISELLEHIGGLQHYEVLLEEDGDAGVYAYLLGDEDCPSHIVAWRPIGIDLNDDGENTNTYDAISASIPLPDQFDFDLGEAIWLDGLQDSYNGNIQIGSNGNLQVAQIAAMPILIQLYEEECLKENCGEITISGRIYTDCDGAEDEVIPGVTVRITGAGPDYDPFTTTDENGYYEFTQLCAGQNYSISPRNTEVDKCGLSQNDVDIIDNHVSVPSTSELNTPYKLLAADINNDKLLESIDAAYLEQFLNGDIPDFYSIGGQHWRFIASDYIFPDPTNPFLTNIIGQRTYNGPIFDQINQNFIAIKIGDVDCSYETACDFVEPACAQIINDCEDAEERGSDGYVSLTSSDLDLGEKLVGLIFNNSGIPAGATILDAKIRFTAKYSNIEIPCNLVIKGEVGGTDNCFSDDDFDISNRPSTNSEAPWEITNAWDSDEIYFSPNISEVLQEIIDESNYSAESPILLMLRNGFDNGIYRSAISFDDDDNPDEAPQLCVSYNPKLTLGGGRGNMREYEKDIYLSLNTNTILNVRNYPNPFDDYTQLDFQLLKDAAVTIKIYNILGQSIYQKDYFLTAGNQYLKIDNLPLQSSTLLNYSLEVENQKITGKIVYMRGLD